MPPGPPARTVLAQGLVDLVQVAPVLPGGPQPDAEGQRREGAENLQCEHVGSNQPFPNDSSARMPRPVRRITTVMFVPTATMPTTVQKTRWMKL